MYMRNSYVLYLVGG